MPVIIHIFVLSNRYVSLPVIRLIQKRPTFRLTILSVTKQYLPYFFFNCYLAAPRPTLGHYRGDSLTHPMLITAFFYIFDPVTGSLVTRLGPLSPAEHLVGFEPGTFRLLLQRLNPLTH